MSTVMSFFMDEGSYLLTRILLQRGMALTYLIAFLVALTQFLPLLGKNGLLPVPLFLRRERFWDTPSVFHFHYSDAFARCIFVLGTLLSLFALSGYSEKFGLPVSMLTWFLLWAMYLSIVNV